MNNCDSICHPSAESMGRLEIGFSQLYCTSTCMYRDSGKQNMFFFLKRMFVQVLVYDYGCMWETIKYIVDNGFIHI